MSRGIWRSVDRLEEGDRWRWHDVDIVHDLENGERLIMFLNDTHQPLLRRPDEMLLVRPVEEVEDEMDASEAQAAYDDFWRL